MRTLAAAHRILVVEDDPWNRESLVTLLGDEGYVVGSASTGREALTQLARDPLPCVLLLDLEMPEMSGTELMGAMAKDIRFAHVPVIIMTGSDEQPTNVVQVFRKPLDVESLLASLATCCTGDACEAMAQVS